MDKGLHDAGHRHVFFCESDEWRRQVLAARWPGVPIYDDVAEFGRLEGGGDDHSELREAAGQQRPKRWTSQPVDLLCGGFPCQDLSVAGQRRGLMHQGGRSNLFFEFARIIDTLRPRWVLLENVPGLLSSNGGRDFGTVLGTLADIGYGMGWRVLDSRFFGVPQRRRRVFIVGALADGDTRAASERAGEVLAVGSRCPGHPPTGTEAGPDVAVASLSGLGTGGPDDNDGQAGRVIATAVSSTLGSPRGHDEQATYAVPEDMGVRRLTPRECERLQGLPDDWTMLDDKTPDSRRYSALGDAVTANVAEWIGRRLAVSTP
jgi:DNA (cytosine-5)-methyltransferase 1